MIACNVTIFMYLYLVKKKKYNFDIGWAKFWNTNT